MITRAPGQGYWNFVVSIMVLVFVVYVTTNGDLPKWFALLTFKAAPPPDVHSVTGSLSGDAAVQTLDPSKNPASAVLKPFLPSPSNGIFPVIKSIGSLFNGGGS